MHRTVTPLAYPDGPEAFRKCPRVHFARWVPYILVTVLSLPRYTAGLTVEELSEHVLTALRTVEPLGVGVSVHWVRKTVDVALAAEPCFVVG